MRLLDLSHAVTNPVQHACARTHIHEHKHEHAGVREYKRTVQGLSNTSNSGIIQPSPLRRGKTFLANDTSPLHTLTWTSHASLHCRLLFKIALSLFRVWSEHRSELKWKRGRQTQPAPRDKARRGFVCFTVKKELRKHSGFSCSLSYALWGLLLTSSCELIPFARQR